MSNEGEELWNKYCSFFYEDFQKQVEYNRRKTEEYFRKLKNTKLLEVLGAKNAENIEQVPVTTYDDYPFLEIFGEQVENLSKITPKKKSELLAEYHMRVGRIAAEAVRDYLPGEAFYVKTSGTTGQSKYILHTETFFENFVTSGIALAVMACSEKIGETKLRKGDIFLNILAPTPYFSGWGNYAAIRTGFNLLPSLKISDEVSDIRRKVWMALKEIEKGRKVAFAAGTASLLYLVYSYIVERKKFYEEYLHLAQFGLVKFYMLYKWFTTSLFWKPKSLEEILPLKGIICSGYDAKLYMDFFRRNFNVEPLNLYGNSEFGPSAIGTIEDRENMIFDLRMGFFEFLDMESGELFNIDELKKGRVYSIVGTPFDSSIVRYRIGDLFRVAYFRDDGMPAFTFESRESNVLDLYGYLRLTENLASRVIMKAGLKESDRWSFTKITVPTEHLHIIMEKDWLFSEEEASKRIYYALLEEDEDFRNLVRDFRIKEPNDIIKVEYIKKRSFAKYSDLRMKRGGSFGQAKPPKIIPSNKMEIFEILRSL